MPVRQQFVLEIKNNHNFPIFVHLQENEQYVSARNKFCFGIAESDNIPPDLDRPSTYPVIQLLRDVFHDIRLVDHRTSGLWKSPAPTIQKSIYMECNMTRSNSQETGRLK